MKCRENVITWKGRRVLREGEWGWKRSWAGMGNGLSRGTGSLHIMFTQHLCFDINHGCSSSIKVHYLFSASCKFSQHPYLHIFPECSASMSVCHPIMHIVYALCVYPCQSMNVYIYVCTSSMQAQYLCVLLVHKCALFRYIYFRIFFANHSCIHIVEVHLSLDAGTLWLSIYTHPWTYI